MVKYFWYVDINPSKISSRWGIKGNVKRSTTPPPSGYPYVIETIDGYKHTVKSNDGKLLFIKNDFGNLYEITNINNLIVSEVESIIETTIEKIRNKKEEKAALDFPFENRYNDYDRLYSSNMLDISNIERRKKRIKSRLNRNPIKKKIIKKKSK